MQKRRLTRLGADGAVLNAVSYRSVLARGFALVRDAARAPLRRAGSIAHGQALHPEFADGEIAATADGAAGGSSARTSKSARARASRGRCSSGRSKVFRVSCIGRTHASAPDGHIGSSPSSRCAAAALRFARSAVTAPLRCGVCVSMVFIERGRPRGRLR